MLKDIEKLKYVADIDSSIEEAWTMIEANRHRSVVVVDKGKAVGTLSDGDLRKAMLARRLLSTSVKEVMNTNFIFLTQDKKAEAEKIFQKRDIFLIPIVDDRMKLVDIWTAPLKL